MRGLIRVAALVALALPLAGGVAHAQYHHQLYHGDIHRFADRDLLVWRGGHWFNGLHGGRRGWWWVVGGVWYFYPAPVYPYPDPYTPPAVNAPPALQAYYFCPASQRYYPYVTSCRVPWRLVPIEAAPPSPTGAPPLPPVTRATPAVPTPGQQQSFQPPVPPVRAIPAPSDIPAPAGAVPAPSDVPPPPVHN